MTYVYKKNYLQKKKNYLQKKKLFTKKKNVLTKQFKKYQKNKHNLVKE
jgi:hypothetical protein